MFFLPYRLKKIAVKRSTGVVSSLFLRQSLVVEHHVVFHFVVSREESQTAAAEIHLRHVRKEGTADSTEVSWCESHDLARRDSER